MKATVLSFACLLSGSLLNAQADLVPQIKTFSYNASDCSLSFQYNVKNSGSGSTVTGFNYVVGIVDFANEQELFSTTENVEELQSNTESEVKGWSLDLTALPNYQAGAQYKLVIVADPDEDLIEFNDENNTYESPQFSCNIVVDISELAATFFTIYPNPSTGVFNIELSENANYSVKVFNVLGQEVLKGENENLIDLSSQNKGVYFIEMQTDKHTITKRIVLD